jgi:drug/metabolite transporter (DMT)-like permease
LKPADSERQVIMNPFAYATVIFIWGTTPLGVQWSAEGSSPFVSALLRMLLATAVLISAVSILRIPFPFGLKARKIYAASILGQGMAMLLVYWSANVLPSALISLIFGFSPLLTGMLGWYLYKERLLAVQCLAIALGALGLFISVYQGLFTVGQDFDKGFDKHYLLALVAMFFACLLFCLSNIWVKRFSGDFDIHPLAMALGSLLFSLPIYLVCVLLGGIQPEAFAFSQKSALAVVYLAVFGSVLAPWCFYTVLKSTSANKVALITLVAPIIALFLATFLNHEQLSIQLVLGALLIILSLLLFQYQGGVASNRS